MMAPGHIWSVLLLVQGAVAHHVVPQISATSRLLVTFPGSRNRVAVIDIGVYSTRSTQANSVEMDWKVAASILVRSSLHKRQQLSQAKVTGAHLLEQHPAKVS